MKNQRSFAVCSLKDVFGGEQAIVGRLSFFRERVGQHVDREIPSFLVTKNRTSYESGGGNRLVLLESQWGYVLKRGPFILKICKKMRILLIYRKANLAFYFVFVLIFVAIRFAIWRINSLLHI